MKIENIHDATIYNELEQKVTEKLAVFLKEHKMYNGIKVYEPRHIEIKYGYYFKPYVSVYVEIYNNTLFWEQRKCAIINETIYMEHGRQTRCDFIIDVKEH